MSAHDPSDRVLVARAAAFTRWSRTDDRTAATAPARKAHDDRFARQVDPDGILDPAERARRADMAKRAYFARLALRSAQVRRARASQSNRPAS